MEPVYVSLLWFLAPWSLGTWVSKVSAPWYCGSLTCWSLVPRLMGDEKKWAEIKVAKKEGGAIVLSMLGALCFFAYSCAEAAVRSLGLLG